MYKIEIKTRIFKTSVNVYKLELTISQLKHRQHT